MEAIAFTTLTSFFCFVKFDKTILRQIANLLGYYNIKKRLDEYKITEHDERNVTFIENVFQSEKMEPESFIRNYVQLLDLPEWLIRITLSL